MTGVQTCALPISRARAFRRLLSDATQLRDADASLILRAMALVERDLDQVSEVDEA